MEYLLLVIFFGSVAVAFACYSLVRPYLRVSSSLTGALLTFVACMAGGLCTLQHFAHAFGIEVAVQGLLRKGQMEMLPLLDVAMYFGAPVAWLTVCFAIRYWHRQRGVA